MNKVTEIFGGRKMFKNNSSQLSPAEEAMAYETRLWIAVVATLLLSEVWMHLLGHQVLSLWGLIPAAVLFGVAGMTLLYYSRVNHISWILITFALGVIGFAIATESLGLALLGDMDLTRILVLGADGPTHGFLAVGHLFADTSVVAIGLYQLARWYRVRDTGLALTGIAALTGCCGTTAILLAPIFTAVLGAFGIHSGVSYVMVATLLTAALVAIAYAWTGGLRREPT